MEVTNRFKGLNLAECVKNYGWRFVTLQDAVIKISPKKKKCKKAKWLSEEALQIAVNRKEAKGKGEKERYTHLNAEFQRIARGDKKAFLKESTLSKWPYYPKQSTDSMQSLSSYQWYFSQN